MTPAFSHLPCMNISEQMSGKVSFARTGKSTLKIFRNNEEKSSYVFAASFWRLINFALLSLGYVSAVRSEIIRCRFSHPAIFWTNRGDRLLTPPVKILFMKYPPLFFFIKPMRNTTLAELQLCGTYKSGEKKTNRLHEKENAVPWDFPLIFLTAKIS